MRRPSLTQSDVRWPPSRPVALWGCHGMWRSLVAHLTGGQGVAGSNPVIPTLGLFEVVGQFAVSVAGPSCVPPSNCIYKRVEPDARHPILSGTGAGPLYRCGYLEWWVGPVGDLAHGNPP